MRTIGIAGLALALLGGEKPAPRPPLLDPARFELVDLTHPLNAETVFWPTSPIGFELKRLAHGKTEAGFFYAANTFCMAEHGGTHLDAPFHFFETGETADRVPLKRLVAAAVVLDVSAKASKDPDYRATAQDVRDFETRNGRIPAGAIALLRTGWSARWPDRKGYLGDDRKGDASNLHFPSFSEEAARLLVKERKVAALGVDTASVDFGQSRDFAVHRLAASFNVPGFENLENLDRLPPTGALVIALPIKIEGGTGGPMRAIALVPK